MCLPPLGQRYSLCALKTFAHEALVETKIVNNERTNGPSDASTASFQVGDVGGYFSRLGHTMTDSAANPADFAMELFLDPADRAAAAARRKDLCDR